MMSDAPEAVWNAGRDMLYVGSRIENTGFVWSLPLPHFSFFSMSEITAKASISEPVAAFVSTAAMGSAATSFLRSSTRSQASPS